MADHTPALGPQLDALLSTLLTRHPEQKKVIEALGPVARAHVGLMTTWRNKKGRSRGPFTAATIPMQTEEALAVGIVIGKALRDGFPPQAQAVEEVYHALLHRPSPIVALCRAVASGEEEPLKKFIENKNLPQEHVPVLAMLLTQIGRTMAAKAALRVKLEPPAETQAGTACPLCGSRADMSIIHGKEGQRSLHCSLCSHVWRYARTACPACGLDEANNLTVLYDEQMPEERAERCQSCGQYILSIDLRSLDVPVELAYYLSLGMGHLDALIQEAENPVNPTRRYA